MNLATQKGPRSSDIEEQCLADLVRQKADLYLDPCARKGLKINPDVLKDICFSQLELTAARKISQSTRCS